MLGLKIKTRKCRFEFKSNFLFLLAGVYLRCRDEHFVIILGLTAFNRNWSLMSRYSSINSFLLGLYMYSWSQLEELTCAFYIYIYIYVSLKIMLYLLFIKTLCAFSNFRILFFISVGSINKICPKLNSSWLFLTRFAISLGIIRSPIRRWGATN